MNTAFSFTRLRKLIIKYGIENGRHYLLSMLALIGCQVIFVIVWMRGSYPNYNETPLYIFYVTGLWISGSVFASQSLSMLNNKTKGTYWLSVPASQAEKLVTTILFSTILFFILYSAGFFLLKSVSLAYLHSRSDVTIEPAIPEFAAHRIVSFFIWGFFALQALYMLGAVYFRGFAFVKTTLFAVLIVLLWMLYYKFLNDRLLGMGYVWRGLDILHFPTADSNEGMRVYAASPRVAATLTWLLRLVWAPLFWIITWFRIKEKQL